MRPVVGYLQTFPFVMAGLVPAIHAFLELPGSKTWMPGTRPGMTAERPEGRSP